MAKKEANIIVRLRDRASSGFRKLAGAVSSVLRPLGLLTAAATAVGTILGVRFLSGAIQSAGAFDERMSAVGAVTGATAEELAKLRDVADEAAARTRFTADQAAAGLEELSRAGFDATASIEALNPVLDLASGNNQSVAESAIQVTTALNAFGLSADKAGRVSDVYTRAAQRSAQTTQQLGEAMTFVAPVARQAGLEIEETAALVGRLADAGFRGSLGGTALRNAILQFQDPASNFREELERLNIRTDNFVGALEGLAGAGPAAEGAIRALGLRAGPAIQAIVAGGVPALQKLTGELRNAEGASEDAARVMEDNLPGAIRAFGSAWDQFRRRLVAPLVVRIKEEVQDLTGALRNFTTSGVLEKFSSLLVNAFNSAVAVVREFVSNIDFQEVGRKIEEFVAGAAERFKRFSTDAQAVRRSFQQILGAIQLFAGSTIAAFNAVATGIAGTFQFLNWQVQRHLQLLQKFTFGLNPLVNRALHEVQAMQRELGKSTDEFAARTVKSAELIAEGYRNMTAEIEQAAEGQREAQETAGNAAEETARRIGASAEELEKFREIAARNREIVRGWDAQVSQAGQTAQRTGQSVQGLGDSAKQTGDQIERSGDQAEVAGEKQERAGGKALTAWLDFGEGVEAVTFKLQELEGTATTLDQLREQAEEAAPPFDRLQQAIEAATETTALDRIIATMARLREEGILTSDEYAALTDTVLDQAKALNEASDATQQQTDTLRELAGQAVQTAAGLDKVNEAARGASQQAKSSAQGFGAVLDSWRELGPDANAEVDKFIDQMNGFPMMSFSAYRTRLAIFTKDMETRFGHLRDATRETKQEVDDFERKSGSISRGGSTTQRKEIDVTFNVKRDEQGPLVLSEADFQTLLSRLLDAIDRDGARTGA